MYKKIIFVFFSMASFSYGAAAKEKFPEVTDEDKDRMLEAVILVFKQTGFLKHLDSLSSNERPEFLESCRNKFAPGLLWSAYSGSTDYEYTSPNAKCALEFIKDNLKNAILIFFEVKAHSKAWRGDGFLKFLLEGVKIEGKFIRLMFHDTQQGTDFITHIAEYVRAQTEPEVVQDGAAAAGAGAGNAQTDKKDVKDQS